MNPYFTNIKNQILSPETRKELVEIGIEHSRTMNKVPTQKNADYRLTIGLSLPHENSEAFKRIQNIDEVKEFEKSLKVKFFPSNLIYMFPVATVTDEGRRHVDKNRGCSIVIPLWPVGDEYAAACWWDNQTVATPVATRGYDGRKAFLFNTKTLHSISRYDDLRFNFQFSFPGSYESTLEAIASGNFRHK